MQSSNAAVCRLCADFKLLASPTRSNARAWLMTLASRFGLVRVEVRVLRVRLVVALQLFLLVLVVVHIAGLEGVHDALLLLGSILVHESIELILLFV